MTTADDQLRAGQLEVALVEYREMRAEIARRSQAQSALIALALTATAAIGSYGFATTSRLEALLALPFVLSGLALIYLHYATLSITIGRYIRTELWPFLSAISATSTGEPELELPSWEGWVARHRQQRGRRTPAGLVTFLGQGIVFGVPAVGALIVTRHLAWGHNLAPIWWLGSLTLAGTVGMVIVVEYRELAPADRAGAPADAG